MNGLRGLIGSQYKLLSKGLGMALAAEHLGKSETAAHKACDPDDADPKSLLGRRQPSWRVGA